MARVHAITMPKWGIEMQEGTITAWNFEPGQAVQKGDGLLDVETEKIVNSVESPVSGTLRRIVANAGDTCAVGALIAVVADADVADGKVDAFIAAFKPADTSFEPEAGPAGEAESGGDAGSAVAVAGESKVSPIARRLAEKLGIDAAKLKGTGRHGRVSREDVEAYAITQGLMPGARTQGQGAAKAAANEPSRERMTSMRLTIARRLTESKQTIPHYRLAADIELGALLERREQLAAQGGKVSINDLLLRACALTLTGHPRVNAQFTGEEVLSFPHADVAVAVSTDSGLVTPIIRLADTKDVLQLAAEVADLAGRARSGQLKREEITGGTFTLSNLGMFGVDRFDAIINPPQVAILAVGAARERMIARDGKPAVARVVTVELSCDHRVVDGAAGGRFLDALRTRIESAEGL